MGDQLVVNVTSYETRVALLESNVVSEIFIERHRDRGIVGDIYLGRVQRVLPGMQAAFVEIGHERAAFLYVGDVVPPDEPLDDDEPEALAEGEDDAALPTADKADKLAHHKKRRLAYRERRIEEVLRQGQEVLVQVTKDAISTKGPRVTCNVSLPGRHVVYMPTHKHIGISRRITNEEERARLRALLETLRPRFIDAEHPEVGGFVVRTVSEGLAEEKLAADVEFLITLWRDIEARAKKASAPALVQPELDIVLRTTRDTFTAQVDKLIVDDDASYEKVARFVGLLDPSLLPRLQHYKGTEPLFEHLGIETELQRAMSRRVWLKSGGYLVIDQAEALTAIDVNTGRFVGKRNLEDTILRTNLEAVREVAYQLRLRNIGGMVIIDFIDMEDERHRERVLQSLSESLTADRARCNVVKMSELGLVEMTRQRTRESLGRQLTETCWYCEGKGALKSKRTVAYDIFRALERQSPRLLEPVVVVQAHPEVVDVMVGEEAEVLAGIEQSSGKRILTRPRGSFHQEQFDIFGTSREAAESQGKDDKKHREGKGAP